MNADETDQEGGAVVPDGGGDRLWALVADRAFDGERFVPDGAQVMVRGTRIVAVEPLTTTLPADCVVIRHPGTTVLPGLIDTHVHLCAAAEPDALALDPQRTAGEREEVIRRSLRQHLAAGVTAVRDLGDHQWAVVDRPERAGEPLVQGSGPPITTPGGHCSAMGGGALTDQDLNDAVRQRLEHGGQIVKIIVSGGAMTSGSDLLRLQYPAAQVRVVVERAHRLGLPVTAHAHSVPAVQACLEAGVDGLEHCTCLTERGIETPPDLMERLASDQVAICPTFGRLPGSAPSPQAVQVMRRTGMSLAARFAQVGRLSRAGAVLVAGSDAGIHPAKPHGVLPYSVIELAGCGLSTAQALATATSLSARACGIEALTGRLRPGLRADLLVVDGDPEATIGDLTRVRRVFVAGRPVAVDLPANGHDH